MLVDTGGFTDPNLVARVFCAARGMHWINQASWNAFPRFYLKARNRNVDAILQCVRQGQTPVSVAVNASLWRSFMLPEHDLRRRAAEVAVPTLLVWGRHDPVIALDRGQLAVRTIPGAQLTVLPTGHMPFAEDPVAFLGAVQPFLAAVGRP